MLTALATPSQDAGAGVAPDEISVLVERAIDERLQAALGELRIEQLLGDARERHSRSAANYVI